MAGFIIGKGINLGVKFIRNAIQLFYLDKVAEYAFRFMGQSCSQIGNCYERIADLASTNIKPIFVNSYTRSLVSWTYNNILTPVGRFVRSIAKFFFKTLLWDWICVPFWNRVVVPVYNRIFPHRSSTDRTITVRERWISEYVSTCLKSIADWTIRPFYSYILNPFFQSVGDFFYGTFSGTLRTDSEEPRLE